jgi:hypothetical protein
MTSLLREQRAETLDHLADHFCERNERWKNKLTLNRRSAGKIYMEGRLAVVYDLQISVLKVPVGGRETGGDDPQRGGFPCHSRLLHGHRE